MGGGNDGKCKRALMPGRRPVSRSGSDLGEVGVSQILLFVLRLGILELVLDGRLWTGAYEREDICHLLFSTLCEETPIGQ